MARTIWRETNPAFLSFDAMLKEQRAANKSALDQTGAEFCRTAIIEPAKASLARPPPKNVTPLLGHGDEAERRGCVEFIDAYCGWCGLCAGFERKAAE